VPAGQGPEFDGPFLHGREAVFPCHPTCVDPLDL
jgi:hypothetical protein